MIIHKWKMAESDWAMRRCGDGAKLLSPCLRVPIFLCLTCFLALSCGAPGQSTDSLFTTANSQLVSAKKSGAGDLTEYKEAQALLTEAEAALENKDRGARSLVKKAYAKARLAEALARQLKAEAEAARLEAELEKASIEAKSAIQEREAAESELKQKLSD